MYQGQSNIVISQVQNGFIVMLPTQPYSNDIDEMAYAVPYPALRESEIRRQTRIQKDELLKDDVLENLKASEETVPKRVPYIDIKEENIFCFKTFKEVLDFLKDKYIPS